MKKRSWINADPKKRKTYRKSNGGTTTVKVTRPICPISNLPLGPSDPRLFYCIVNSKKVPVNSDAFLDYCRKGGLRPPKSKISFKEFVEVEPWLINIAKEVAATPEKEVGKKWFFIQNLADIIGLKTNLITAVR